MKNEANKCFLAYSQMLRSYWPVRPADSHGPWLVGAMWSRFDCLASHLHYVFRDISFMKKSCKAVAGRVLWQQFSPSEAEIVETTNVLSHFLDIRNETNTFLVVPKRNDQEQSLYRQETTIIRPYFGPLKVVSTISGQRSTS